MFTGLIEEVGTIEKKTSSHPNIQVKITANRILDGLRLGDSVAVDGVCLTVVSILPSAFCADLSPETERATTLGDIPPGRRVNLERSMKWGDRLGGHMVLGHVDGVGTIRDRLDEGGVARLTVEIPFSMLRYCIRKGAIAVDGVSLTLNTVNDQGITFCIVPHTASTTTFGTKSVGAHVNLESDPIAKYVETLLRWSPAEDRLLHLPTHISPRVPPGDPIS